MPDNKSRDGTNKDTSSPIKVRESDQRLKPVRRTFPGPRGASEILRVAVERGAHAELIAHAKSSLQAEVCGVLAGQVCEDDEGVFVHVEAVIRGTAASERSTHVTFTQDTWNAIYKVLEHDFPKLKIVGWYHTHPGFGVEFSEMDLFIQRNFFAGPAQIALVTDPVNGDVAICVNTAKGIEYLRRSWIDGREQHCRVPERALDKLEAGQAGAVSVTADSEATRSLEARVGQLLQAVDEMRVFHYRFMMTCGIVFCLALVAIVGYSIYSQWSSRLEPPKINQIVPVPVQIDGKTVLLGVAITTWEVPNELNAILLQAEMLKREAEEKAAKADSEKQGATNAVSGKATNVPPAPPAK